jgi:hypothetical protein
LGVSNGEDSAQARESELYSLRLDPIARDVLAATDPWDAYREANKVSPQLTADFEWLPHGGEVLVAWAELADVYDTGKTPITDAHAALRQAASIWLDRPGLPNAEHIERWLRRAHDAAHALFRRDGDFWHST